MLDGVDNDTTHICCKCKIESTRCVCDNVKHTVVQSGQGGQVANKMADHSLRLENDLHFPVFTDIQAAKNGENNTKKMGK